MTREFEIPKEVELEASPKQVWEAIATARPRRISPYRAIT